MEKQEVKLSADERQNFVSTRMSLPLFMLSRNRIREDHLGSVKKQFQLAGNHYNAFCQDENRGKKFSAATYAHYREVTGLAKMPVEPFREKRPLTCDRSMTKWRGYQLAPNRYGVLPEPYLSRRGAQGTIFNKMHLNKSRVTIKPPPHQFYEIAGEIERLFSSENRQKGIFLTNARERRPSSHNMVNDLTICWRNPSDPGPYDTHTGIHEIQHNMTPLVKTTPDNPHLFLRLSCVPKKRDVYIRRNISFEPGPGRYEIRYPNICVCERGKKTFPRLTVFIERQKRFKFRRLPYKPVNIRKYCEPDWRHVIGYGHRHIFMMGKHDLPKTQVKKVIKGKKTEKQLTLYADGKYLGMLINPRRFNISFRDYELLPYVPRIVYNSIAKRIVRKQLRNNKKIAFMSGQERWKDGVRQLQLTQRQLDAIKASLPEDRRLYDHPIDLRASRLLSRLHQVPDHLRSTYIPKLRKRLYKFLPIPGARVLVTDNDIRADLPFDPENPTGMYNVKMDVTAFFLDSVLREMEMQRLGITPETAEDRQTLTSEGGGESTPSNMSGGSKSSITRAIQADTEE